MTTSLSNSAPSSVRRFFHSSTAMSHCSPSGANSRPRRYSKVVSSGATRPALAPPSMDMLHTVMRPSIESCLTASPRYSITCPTPPTVPMRLRMPSMRSLAVTSAGSSPSTVTAMVFGRLWVSVWVARTCSTSLVPMPKASAPNAPWVEVWESPQTITSPGWVSPVSGPIMWTMPCPMEPHSLSLMPGSSPREPGADLRRSGRAPPRRSAPHASPRLSLPASSDDSCSLLRLCNLGRGTRNVSTFFYAGQRGPAGHDVETHVVKGGPAVHRHLLRHRCCEGAPLLFRKPLQVPAEHDRPEETSELVHRIERRDLVVQPGLDLLAAGGFQASRRRPGVGVVFVVLPANEIVPEALLFHRLNRRSCGASDIALAPALRDEAPTRL